MKICYGTTRTTVLIGEFAFKAPALTTWKLFLLGLLGNTQEKQFSSLKWDCLCPVTFSIIGGFLLVMPRVQPLTREEFESFDFDSWAEDNQTFALVENKLDSFGWYNGRLVAVDYGS